MRMPLPLEVSKVTVRPGRAEEGAKVVLWVRSVLVNRKGERLEGTVELPRWLVDSIRAGLGGG